MPAKSEKRCEECGDLLVLKSTRDLLRKRFCSRSCLGRNVGKKRDMAYMQQQANTAEANGRKGHAGAANPNWAGGNHIEECCEEGGVEFTTTKTKRRQGYGKYCSRACSAKAIGRGREVARVRVECEVCGAVVEVLPYRAKVQKTCSTSCSAVKAIQSTPRQGTKLELAVMDILYGLGLDYKEQVALPGTVVDFMIGDIVIYADGDYWHSKPGVPERDARINERLTNEGYTVLRLPESLVHQRPEEAQRQIEEVLHACG